MKVGSIQCLKVEDRPVSSLKAYPRNPRKHSRKQVQQIAASIRRFGFVNPILIDAAGRVIAGHGRLEAARLLGIDTVPTIPLDGLTEAQKRAYLLADNKLAANASWNRQLLALELRELSELEIDLDLTITGFDMAEIDVLLEVPAAGTHRHDQVPEVDNSKQTSIRPGDLGSVGKHRLLWANATKPGHLSDSWEAREHGWSSRTLRITCRSIVIFAS